MGNGYTYPVGPVKVTQQGTATEVHQFLKTPSLIARRIAELTAGRYIADYLLPGRYVAQGGAILFENGDEVIFANDDAEAVGPGGEYAITTFEGGTISTARTQKFGRDAFVTDEAITRMLFNPADRAFQKLANSSIRSVDRAALGVIASRVTDTYEASGSWRPTAATPEAALAAFYHITADILLAKATKEEELEGFDYSFDTVVLKPTQLAIVRQGFMQSGQLSRDAAANAAITGVIPDVMGLNWATSPNVPFPDPLFLDRDLLGGMANENIQSPGYARRGDTGVEAKTIRDEERDRYRLRTRRTTVPVVLDGKAGFRITGTGL